MSEIKKYNLIILESPHKAAVLSKFLAGMNFKCISSKGHILELPKNLLGIDLNTFDLDLVPMVDKKSTIDEIKRLAKDADKIYLASDPDLEGAAISVHIRSLIKKKDSDFHRLLIYEITKSAILKAIANPTTIDPNQYNAQKTRRALDRLVGYKVSPVLWDKLGGEAKSAGRVQSVALRFIVDREDEIKNFVPEKFFQIVAKLEKTDIKFESKYFGEQIDKKTDLTSDTEALARQIHEEIKKQDFTVKSVTTKEKKQNPSAPFTTSRLQQESSTKLKFNSKLTMSLCQELYEGISLGEKGEQGLITYMRTDSVRTEPQALIDVRDYINTKYGTSYLPKEAILYKTKNASAQEAHEAIRPTSLANDPDSIKKYLNNEQFELYRLIWNKFVSSQMTPAVLDQTVVLFDVKNHFFKSVGNVVKFDGFKAIYVDGDAKKDEGDDGALPKLELEESLTPLEPPKLLEKFTSPPPRYTEASLIKNLEENGIGRPSTYSAIISNISDRNYVTKNDGKFQPTVVGSSLCYFLLKHFSDQMDYAFTAKMEEKLDKIESGSVVWTDVLREFWTGLSATIEKTNKEVLSVAKGPRTINPNSLSGIQCPKCNSHEMIIIKGKNGEFLGCSSYPECKSTSAFKRNKSGQIKLVEKKETLHKNPCMKCGSPMALRSGKFGDYFSCLNFPACTATRPKTTGIICPDCKTGEYTKKSGKNGEFYACSGYPVCKNIMNFKPIDEPCTNPDCKYPIRGYNERGKKIELICPKCKKMEIINS